MDIWVQEVNISSHEMNTEHTLSTLLGYRTQTMQTRALKCDPLLDVLVERRNWRFKVSLTSCRRAAILYSRARERNAAPWGPRGPGPSTNSASVLWVTASS